MTIEAEATARTSDSAVLGVCVIWITGILATLLSFRVVLSGTMWNWGFPAWLINSVLLVGLWQWIWIFPLVAYARRTAQSRLHRGFLRGGISFSILQLSLCAAAYFLFRHLRFQ